MSFPAAQRRQVTVIETAEGPPQTVETGWVNFTYLSLRAWPLTAGGTCP
jgi:hypothetical protein